MRKVVWLLAFFGVFTYGVAASAAEKIVVEKSPFGEAFFVIRGHAGGLVGGLDVARKKGEEDANDFHISPPNGELQLGFSKIVLDTETMESKLRSYWLTAKWSKVEISVDPSSKGMTISYERLSDVYRYLEKVVLTVPSELDKKLWFIKAERFYAQYTAAFWEKKFTLEMARKKAKDEETVLIEALQQGPIQVYPRD